jgi:diaminohydroxyphosphoribosylaminopyrimidine deaminase/5-amino-6-(5-phosphoribosylamino)uracil reductase
MTLSIDAQWMLAALDQARLALPLSAPNPAVGCVIVRDGELLGHGHTQAVGGPHAEVMALRDAQARGHSVRGATAYVTLEPCAHHGRTPPCADALVREGLARVVIACADPNPLVAGQGVARMVEAGIEVLQLPPEHAAAQQAREILIGFLSRMVRQRPWVRMKVAASLDGRTALDNGESQWITGPAARVDGQHWRARASAVLTGIGTVLEDNPRLNVRVDVRVDVRSNVRSNVRADTRASAGVNSALDAHPEARPLATPRQPLRVVLDGRWRTPPDAAMFANEGGVLVVGLAPQGAAAEARQRALGEAGAQLLTAPSWSEARVGAGPSAPSDNHPGQEREAGRVDIAWLLHALAQRGVNELHVEAGATLNGHLIDGDWVDEILMYLAPKLLGPGRALAALSPLSSLGEAWQGQVRDMRLVGDDVRLILRPAGRERF